MGTPLNKNQKDNIVLFSGLISWGVAYQIGMALDLYHGTMALVYLISVVIICILAVIALKWLK